MDIRQMTATFGALQNRRLSLQSGLNIIYAPNESGKSTWCHFLRVMLYGLQGRGDTADKSRYAPWSGGTMAGVMDITADDKNLTIRRSTKRAASPMGDLTCVYSDTSTAYELPAGLQPGDAFLGISQSIFERSAFIGQSALALSQTPELEKRIASLITTGDEETSFSETYDRLKKQLNRRRHNRTGEIPQSEAEIALLKQKIAQINSLTGQKDTAQTDYDRCQQAVSELEEQQHRWQIITRQEEAEYAQRRRAQAQVRLQQLNAQCKTAQEQYAAHPFYGKSERDLAGMADNRTIKTLPNPKWRLMMLCCGAMSLAVVLGSLITHRLLLAAIAAVLVIGCTVGVLIHTNITNKVTQHNAQLGNKQEVLQAQIAQLRLLAQNAENTKTAYEQYAEFFSSLPDVPAEAEEEVEPPALSPEEVERQLESSRSEFRRLRSSLDMLTGQLVSLGHPEILTSRLQKEQENLQILQDEYDAVAMAMDVLEGVNNELQNRFSPALGQRAADIFRKITGDKYEKVFLSREFQMQAQTTDDPVARTAALLSQGTVDQLYLAVRLAICDMVLPEECAVPLILDDALLTFDDQRLHAALDYLAEEGKHRQILLFTCQHREEEYLRKHPGVTVTAL